MDPIPPKRVAAEEVIGLNFEEASDGSEIAAAVAETATEATDLSVEMVGLVDDPADRIVDSADRPDARYAVVGPRKRSPASKAFSVASYS